MSKIFTYGGSYPSIRPETNTFLTYIGIANDGTIYNIGTPQQITGAEIWQGVNALIIGLINSGIWAIMNVIYLRIGGTTARIQVNAKNPLLYEATYYGGVVNNELGSKWNGSNSYAITGYIPPADFSQSYWAYSNEAFSFNTGIEMGVLDYTGSHYLTIRPTGNSGGAINEEGTSAADSSDGRGFYGISRESASVLRAYKNGVNTSTRTSTATQTRSNNTVFLGAANFTGAFAAVFSQARHSFCAMGGGLTTTQAATFYTLVQAFETAMKRNV
jgi:hypothetical protein